MPNFVRNLHSNHVHITGPGGNIMAAIFHKSRKRFTKKKRRTQTKVMKDAMKTRKLTPRPKIFVVKTIHHLVAMVTYKYRLVQFIPLACKQFVVRNTKWNSRLTYSFVKNIYIFSIQSLLFYEMSFQIRYW